MSAPDSFGSLRAEFGERIAELKRLSLLRVPDSAKDLYQQDMDAIDVRLLCIYRVPWRRQGGHCSRPLQKRLAAYKNKTTR